MITELIVDSKDNNLYRTAMATLFLFNCSWIFQSSFGWTLYDTKFLLKLLFPLPSDQVTWLNTVFLPTIMAWLLLDAWIVLETGTKT